MRASCYRSRFSWLRVCPGVKIIDGIFEVDCYCCRALISSFPFLLHPLVFPVFLSLSRFPHSNPGGAYVVKGQEYPVGRPHVTACGRSVADRPNLTEATEGEEEEEKTGTRGRELTVSLSGFELWLCGEEVRPGANSPFCLRNSSLLY